MLFFLIEMFFSRGVGFNKQFNIAIELLHSEDEYKLNLSYKEQPDTYL